MPEENDPFLIAPELWFAVLCHGVSIGKDKHISIDRIFNRWHMSSPPGYDGGSFGHLKAHLALGFSSGVGAFDLAIELRDIDEHVLWRLPQPLPFIVGPGDANGAVFGIQFEYFFKSAGSYHFRLMVTPGDVVALLRFEVADPPLPTAAPTS